MSRLHFLDTNQRLNLIDSRRRQRKEVSPGVWVALILAGIVLLGMVDAKEPHSRPLPVNGISR